MGATQSHSTQSVDADVVDGSIGVLWVPDWPIVAAIAEGELPGHLPSVLCHNSRVQAVSAQARRLGIRVGMSKRTAQSLAPDLVAGQDNPVQRVRAFEPVMNAVEQVVANAVILRPGLVMFGAKGAVNFHGGQNQLGERLLGAAAHAGVEAHVGVAVGILPAILAARHSAFIPPQRTRAFLYPHPVGAILHAATTSGAWREYKEVISSWEKLGLTRVGDVARLDRGVVAARFGRVGVEAHRLAQGLGWVDLNDEQAGERVQVGSDIDPPAQRVDTAAFIARNLAQQLHDALIRRGLACHSLRVVALTEAGERHDRSWRLEGVPKVGEVTDRVRWQLSGWLEGR
ncbi:MAG TPA: DNA polymerase Y family protein, partial [Beutenbergiaceae bacterium]|nr:DNA polymerase Y family protein [Beutenbergiaceae bacterium]